jgi:phage tail sheath gpL-like
MALIPILGVPSSYRTPGALAQILFAQGPASAALGARQVVIVAPRLAAASAVAGTLYPVGNEKDIIDVAGSGSPAHRAARIFLKANKGAKLWYLGMAPTTGGAPVAATGTITFTNTATGTGSCKITICGEEVTFSVASGDTVTNIAVAAKAAVNAVEHLPVTADNSSGVLTLTAKIAGTSQGDGTVPVIRFRAEITSGIATTVATSGVALGISSVAGVEGSTTEPAQLANALAALANVRKYYVVCTTWNATGLTNIVTHVSSKSEPNPGLRSVAIVGYNGALAAAQTLATARNYERLQLAWQRNSEHDPAEIAGNMAAIRQKYEGVDSAFNFDGYRGADWLIKPARAVADFPSGADQNDAINDGVTPIASDGNGSYLVMSVNTRSKNAAGSVDDFRATETHRVSVADEFVDDLLQTYALRYSAAKVKSDATLANGDVNTNQRLQRGVVTPSTFKPWIGKKFSDYEDAAKIQNADASKESLRVVRDPSNAGRLEVGLDLHVIDHLHQMTVRVAEVSTG